MKQIPFPNLKGKPSFQPPSWMQRSLGGMHLDLRCYAGGMQTYHRAVLAHSSCSLKNKRKIRAVLAHSSCSLKNKHKFEQCSSSLKNEPIPVNNLGKCNLWQPYKSPWSCLCTVTSIRSFGQSFISIWLFTLFEEQLRRVISLSHPCDTAVIGKFQTLPGISCYPILSLGPQRRVSFKLFSTDS